MENDSPRTVVRPVAWIRYLGLLLGVVIGLPSWLGWGWFLFNPAELVANPGGVAFTIVIGGIALVATWRWMTIRGTSSESLICLRGWWRTVEVIPSDLSAVRLVQTSWQDTASGNLRRGQHYKMFDHRGESLGVVPWGLEISRDWDSFLNRLHRTARKSRQHFQQQSADKPSLAELHVDDWTPSDIERYERES